MNTGRIGGQPFGLLRNELDRQFSQLWGNLAGGVGPGTTARAFPSINIWEQRDEFMAEAEVPGVKVEDLDISVAGNELTLKGRRPDIAEDGTIYHRRERGVGSFTRMVRLPVEIDSSRVEASLRDGVLTLKLPKPETVKPRKIKVNAVG